MTDAMDGALAAAPDMPEANDADVLELRASEEDDDVVIAAAAERKREDVDR